MQTTLDIPSVSSSTTFSRVRRRAGRAIENIRKVPAHEARQYQWSRYRRPSGKGTRHRSLLVVEDVQDVRPDLSDEQSLQLLQRFKADHDATLASPRRRWSRPRRAFRLRAGNRRGAGGGHARSHYNRKKEPSHEAQDHRHRTPRNGVAAHPSTWSCFGIGERRAAARSASSSRSRTTALVLDVAQLAADTSLRLQLLARRQYRAGAASNIHQHDRRRP